MSIAGLKDAVVAPLVRALVDADLDRDAVAERFARVAWNALAEPGDGDAGALIQAFGALPALERVIAAADGPSLARDLSELADDPESTDDGRWCAAHDRWRPRLHPDAVLRSLQQAARFGVRLVVPGDPEWPDAIDDLGPHAPSVLWVRGDPARLRDADCSVALVGARAATGYGEHVAVELASGLVDRGVAIISGGAYGIDGAAHRSALASGGRTVAVLAGGLDRFYPAGHEQLLTRISEQGAVVAEVPCGTTPSKWRFLQRNRVIAALGQVTVVVEAGWRSGALNTANHAARLARPVGAVPGPVTSSASAGCHRLLRDGAAVCVTGADDVAELLPSSAPAEIPAEARASENRASAPADRDGTRTRLLDALSARSPRAVGQLAAISGLASDRVRAELGLLELSGGVRESGGGWIRAR